MGTLPEANTGHGDGTETADGKNAPASVTNASSDAAKASPTSKLAPRSLPHSLLGPHDNGRKGAHAGIEHSTGSSNRASISMPPPSTKPSTNRRLSSTVWPARKSEDLGRSPPTSVKSDEGRPLGLSNSPPAPVSTTAIDTNPVMSPTALRNPGLPLFPPPGRPAPAPSDTLDTGSSQPSRHTTPEPNVTSAPSVSIWRDSALPVGKPRTVAARSVSANRRRFSGSTMDSEGSDPLTPGKVIGKVGVCALDVKARSRPSRQILTRIQAKGEFEVIVFGDKAILDEAYENWPICDFLIAFFSEGFPLDKAISYVKLRKPFVVNDLHMQKVLWDRRLCLRILDHMRVPTPKRVEVNRDGGPRLESVELAEHMYAINGLRLEGSPDGMGGGAKTSRHVELIDHGDTLVVDGQAIRKPFVEKPVNGDDHNVIIYFPRGHHGENDEIGGARRLFRKIGNKSSDFDPHLVVPRCLTEADSSYIYEQFLQVENAEDVKAYTVGPDFCHAETRKSPVVDGLVRRNTHGKEIRYITNLNREEMSMASRVATGFGQRICGFDMLRTQHGAFVIDVNGWSFVKDNNEYYDNCANILKDMFTREKIKHDGGDLAQLLDEASDGANPRPGAYRSALNTILRSPSMKNLAGHLPHTHGPKHRDSLASRSSTIPLSSPSTMERQASIHASHLSQDAVESLPPLVITTASPTSGVPPLEKPNTVPLPSSKHSWKLKGMVAVIRHADRTPKQKLKFTAHSQVFADLLNGHTEEVLLKGPALARVEAAIKTALDEKLEDRGKLKNLRNALARKGGQPGTKVQIKPMFRIRKAEEMDAKSSGAPEKVDVEKAVASPEAVAPATHSPRLEEGDPVAQRVVTRSDSLSGATFSRFSAAENDLMLDKMQLVMKWGGEPTHSARYQSQDLGTNMRDDIKLLNREVLDDVRIFTSSENRVKTSASIWAAAFLGREDLPPDFISVRKDLLDDSNAAKDVMDKVKKKLKHLLREGNSAPPQFAWPKDTPEPSVVMSMVVELLRFHRRVMRHNYKKLETSAVASLHAINGTAENKEGSEKEPLTATSIQARWCTGEDADLFRERWEKLFAEFCDTEKADPSKVSELYDTMKYDALHNKPFLEWVFTPSQPFLDEIGREEAKNSTNPSPDPDRLGPDSTQDMTSSGSNATLNSLTEKHTIAERLGLRRRSVFAQPPSTPPLSGYEEKSYFKLFGGSGDSRSKVDKKLAHLRELYRYAKILFDYISPQEYGMSDHEKLEIGLLTSLPLLREIVQDLEELQASGDAKSFIYFTKESHIYTLLNCIMEGGIATKIKRSAIPELDYLSQICFELYEAIDSDTGINTYSIRISISPGCHTRDPLDVSLDSKHAIGSAPRRSLTNHQDWKEVLETLKAKFNTVELPASFLAINVSDKYVEERGEKTGEERGREPARVHLDTDAAESGA